MSQVVATAERVVRAPGGAVRAALADYEGARPRIAARAVQRLPGRVRRPGRRHPGALAVRRDVEARVRDQVMTVTQPTADTLVETDAELLDGHHVDGAPRGRRRSRRCGCAPPGTGAGGIGGFFERTFAPEGAAPGLRPDARAARRRARRRLSGGATGDSQGTMGR